MIHLVILLQQDAAALDDESRQRFLTGVPIHRDLVAAYISCPSPAPTPA